MLNMTANEKRNVAASAARAIFELDKTSMSRGNDPVSEDVRAARNLLRKAMTEAGYEMSSPDSARIRKIKPNA